MNETTAVSGMIADLIRALHFPSFLAGYFTAFVMMLAGLLIAFEVRVRLDARRDERLRLRREILAALVEHERPGREIRRAVDRGRSRSLDSFYQLMMGLEDDGLVEGFYFAADYADNGTPLKERAYRITSEGRETIEDEIAEPVGPAVQAVAPADGKCPACGGAPFPRGDGLEQYRCTRCDAWIPPL